MDEDLALGEEDSLEPAKGKRKDEKGHRIEKVFSEKMERCKGEE